MWSNRKQHLEATCSPTLWTRYFLSYCNQRVTSSLNRKTSDCSVTILLLSCAVTKFLQFSLYAVDTVDSDVGGSRKFLRGNLLWQPSYRHIWRWVIVSPEFFVAISPPSSFVKCELPFLRGLESCKHICHRTVNHMVMIMCADCAEWWCKIWRYNNSPLYVKVNIRPPPHSIKTGFRKRPDSPF